MKIVFVIQITFLFFLSSCTDEIIKQKEVLLKDSELFVIKTKHINASIKAGNYSKSKKVLIYNTKGDKTEGWVLSYDKSEITISPNKKSFDEILYNYQRKEKLNSPISSTKVLQSDSNSVLIKEVNFIYETGEIKEEGYTFSVVINGFELKGSGENPLKPIKDIDQAKKLILISKSFKPSK